MNIRRPALRSSLLSLLLASLMAFIVVSCDSGGDGDTEQPDIQTQEDAGSSNDVGAVDVAPGPDAAGEDVIEPFEHGARAIIAADEDLIGGPTAAGTAGDILLKNDHVRFVVRARERSLFSPYSGALVDADIVRAPGEPGEDRFFEVFPMIGFGGVFRGESVEIVDDGLVSGTAIVRFQGSDGGMSLIDSIIPTSRTGLAITLEYVLTPEAKHLEIVTTVHNPTDGAKTTTFGALTQLGSRLRKFYDVCGEDMDCLMSNPGTRWIAGTSEKVSYALSLPGPETLSMLLAEDALMLLTSGTFRVEPNESLELRQYFAVGGGAIDEVVETVLTLRGEDPGAAVPIQVELADEISVPTSAFLSAREAGQETRAWVNATRPNADGVATMHLPAGTWDIVLDLPGAPQTVLTELTVDGTPDAPVEFTANAAGHLRVRVTDGEGQPMTAAAALQSGHDAAWLTGVAQFAAVHAGDRTIEVLPGDYTLTVSHGLTWNIDRQNVTVAPGTVTELVASITPAFDTSGGLMMNTHEHCERSLDSDVPVEDRVWNAVANGIDIMNPTDHDFFGGHEATIARLGLEDEVKSFVGCEVSPLWGHTTATGCLAPPEFDTYYAVNFTLYDEEGSAVRGLTATEIYEECRDVFQCEFLAVNHPYRGGATFETYDVYADTDPADAAPELDLTLVDALEVYNKNDGINDILDENVPVWFNLLNRGYDIAGIGGSDEHGYSGNYGNPRNWVPYTGPVAGVEQTPIFDAVKQFRSLVVGGPFIRIDADGAGMGETATAPGGVVSLHVEILAPEWMGLSFANLYANGELIHEFAPTAEGEVVRLDETIELTLEDDAHLVVVAGSLLGEHDMTPVSGKPPISITNPVFIDVDGDGYTPIQHVER